MLDTIVSRILSVVSVHECVHIRCACVSKKTSDIESEAGRADENGG